MTGLATDGTVAPWRIPIESSRPIVTFAWTRLGLTLISIVAMAVLSFPYSWALVAVIAGLVLPWSLANLLVARRVPLLAVSPLVAVGDVALLIAIELAAPETYGAVRFVAIAFLAVHAHFQGARLGLAVAGCTSVGLVGVSGATEGGEVTGSLLVFYEAIFVTAAVSTAILVGGFRTVESASRLRARDLTRRTLRRESEVRRQIAEALHDGPVQEMVGLGMALDAAHRQAEREGATATTGLIAEARSIAERNVRSLRGEMIDLGPHAFKEMSYTAALERCMPVWERRYGLHTELQVEVADLPSHAEGDLFRITQEAVVNATKHGGASRVRISLRARERQIELSILDDGSGFGDVDPLGPTEPGHIGLASMRERAELLGGTLEIESSAEGASVTVRAPRPAPDP